ncbi:MAG: hypothetical protein M0Z61_08690 [Nitrospiraceae bacterium]|nr:hypothetical protein [Nitrospiraceae bacterium]
MKNLPWGWIITGYIFFVFLAFFWVLMGFSQLLCEKYPRLINRKWKRVLWLLSCFLLIPLPASLLGVYSFISEEIKDFINWDEDENGGEE